MPNKYLSILLFRDVFFFIYHDIDENEKKHSKK